MDKRTRHILRRKRCFRHNGRCVRIRQPVQPGVRYEHGGAEHGAVQRRAELRVVLRDPVRERRQVVPAGVHRRDCHQLLPAQQRSPEQRRRLVQSSPPPLRPLPARFPAHRPVPRRHRPRRLPQRALPEKGRHKVHDQRPFLLQPRPHHQRGRRRGRPRRLRQGFPHRVAAHVPELGPELAEQQLPQWPEPVLQGHHQRRPHCRLRQRGACWVVLRPDLHRSAVLVETLRRAGHHRSRVSYLRIHMIRID